MGVAATLPELSEWTLRIFSNLFQKMMRPLAFQCYDVIAIFMCSDSQKSRRSLLFLCFSIE